MVRFSDFRTSEVAVSGSNFDKCMITCTLLAIFITLDGMTALSSFLTCLVVLMAGFGVLDAFIAQRS